MNKQSYALFFLLLISCRDNRETSTLPDFFVDRVWSSGVYSNECTGDSLDLEGRFILYNYPVDFKGVFGDSLVFANSVNFSKVKSQRIRVTTNKLNPSQDTNDYYIRLSPVAQKNNRSYQVLWVKRGYYSSGFYYLFDITDKGDIHLIAIERLCDAWG